MKFSPSGGKKAKVLTPEEAEAILKMLPKEALEYRYERDLCWISEHWEELKRRYPGKFIAVRDGKLVDYDEDRNRLEQRLKGRFGSLWALTVIFIPPKEYKILLRGDGGA